MNLAKSNCEQYWTRSVSATPDDQNIERQLDKAIISIISEYLGAEIENFNIRIHVKTDTSALWEAEVDIYKYQPLVIVINNRNKTIHIIDDDMNIKVYQSENRSNLAQGRYWILELLQVLFHGENESINAA